MKLCRVIIDFILFSFESETFNFFLQEAFLVQVMFYKPVNRPYVHFLQGALYFARCVILFPDVCLEYLLPLGCQKPLPVVMHTFGLGIFSAG